MDDRTQSIDRRLFLGAGASTLMALPALAQQTTGAETPKPSEPKPAATASMPSDRWLVPFTRFCRNRS